jgi:hypothetical protein
MTSELNNPGEKGFRVFLKEDIRVVCYGIAQ